MNTYYPFTIDRRRGVTLLIVLAMMVMFAMLVTTFMVVVSLNRQNS
jgi:Tfp pilus assembly protein PilX